MGEDRNKWVNDLTEVLAEQHRSSGVGEDRNAWGVGGLSGGGGGQHRPDGVGEDRNRYETVWVADQHQGSTDPTGSVRIATLETGRASGAWWRQHRPDGVGEDRNVIVLSGIAQPMMLQQRPFGAGEDRNVMKLAGYDTTPAGSTGPPGSMRIATRCSPPLANTAWSAAARAFRVGEDRNDGIRHAFLVDNSSTGPAGSVRIAITRSCCATTTTRSCAAPALWGR